MKLTESRLRQIINQEARRMLSETKYGMHNMPGPGDSDPEGGVEEDTDTAYLKCRMSDYGIRVDEVGLSSTRNDINKIESRLAKISDLQEIEDMLAEYGLNDEYIMFADDSDAHGVKSYKLMSVNSFYREMQRS